MGIRRTTICASALAVMALSASAANAVPAGAVRSAAVAPAGVSGSYTVYFTWNGSPQRTTTWTVSANHTVTDGFAGAGTWSYSQATKVFTVRYDTGCSPTYTGTRYSGGFKSGKMVCTKGTRRRHGTWYSTRP